MKGFKLKFGDLEESIWVLENSRNSTGKVLEKSSRFVTKKGYEPCSSTFQWSAPFMFPCTGCYHFVTCLSEKKRSKQIIM